MIEKEKYTKFFACCIPVKGAKRAIICDFQRNKYDFVPIDFIDIIIETSYNKISSIISKYGKENQEILLEYYKILLEREYGFLCDKNEIALFPDLNLEWDYPAKISNAIIDNGNLESLDYYNSIFQQLEIIGCRDIELRFFQKITIYQLSAILSSVNKDSKVKNIELIIEYNNQFTEKRCTQITDDFPRINRITIYNSPFDKIYFSEKENITHYIFTSQLINDNSHCGIIAKEYFVLNIQTFTESQKHNTCLNRKISIDVNGEIKNCPSMLKSYGNIKDTTLAEAIEKPGFKDMWYIYKDQIEVCKDCEFRHICTDCRAFIKDPNNIYSKPAKCSYDPYTATWGHENPTNNPLHGK
jgi:SPASM domain peptide maturase of grasp-with-spasm system